MRIVAALTLAAAALSPAPVWPGEVALVVHPSNPARDFKWSEVLAIFREEQQHWKGGRKIYLILLEAGSPERKIVLRRVYRMTDVELKQFWLGKLYRGEIAAFPRVVASSAAAKRIVARAPNALAFIDAAAVDGTVKAVRIEGRRPGEPGYHLSAVP
jgi:phosphate transport system substrate-binding protein